MNSLAFKAAKGTHDGRSSGNSRGRRPERRCARSLPLSPAAAVRNVSHRYRGGVGRVVRGVTSLRRWDMTYRFWKRKNALADVFRLCGLRSQAIFTRGRRVANPSRRTISRSAMRAALDCPSCHSSLSMRHRSATLYKVARTWFRALRLNGPPPSLQRRDARHPRTCGSVTWYPGWWLRSRTLSPPTGFLHR